MELHRYDVIEAELKYKSRSGSLYTKRRPYVIVSNESGTTHSGIITVVPLTHIIKKTYLPVHGCIEAESRNGLARYSMIAGEQPQTIDKSEVIKKYGSVVDQDQRNIINRVCFNSFFYGEDINWEEVFK